MTLRKEDYLSKKICPNSLRCGSAVVLECHRHGQRGWMLPGGEFTASRVRADFVVRKMADIMDRY